MTGGRRLALPPGEKGKGVAGRFVAFVLLAAVTTAAAGASVWYEDNNLGRPGGSPADFVEKFRHPESFRQAARQISVYMIRANVLAAMDDEFIATLLIPYLRENGIRLAVDAVGATWMQAAGRHNVASREIELFARLRRLGAEVSYVSLQSVLSKPLVLDGHQVDYPLHRRIEDVVAYARAVLAVYPQAEIGIIDALPSHGADYRRPYRLLRDALAAAGMRLSYIHLDMPFEIPQERRHGITWQTVRQVERYVEEDLGLRFGFLATSRRGGEHSSRMFHDRVMAALECYAGAGGTPGDYVVAAWFPYPDRTVPDSAVGDDYPAMRTVLEFGRRLRKIDASGSSWAVERAHDPSWRAMCNA